MEARHTVAGIVFWGCLAAGVAGPAVAQDFRRGDSNGDTRIDIADAVWSLNYLFAGGGMDCLDAADTNADGTVNVSDPVALINYLFAGGTRPPAPFSECGEPPAELPRVGCEVPQCSTRVWMARADGCFQCEPCTAIEEIVSVLETAGFTVLDFQHAGMGINVCLACTVCSSGRGYFVLLSKEDAGRLAEEQIAAGPLSRWHAREP